MVALLSDLSDSLVDIRSSIRRKHEQAIPQAS